MPSPSSRLLDLLSLLQVRRDWPGAVLSDRLGVSARTVRRDVDRLRGMGYTITALLGPDGGYRLDAGSELPPMRFDDDQAVALAVALQTAAVSGVDIAEAAERALATVRQLLPSRLRHRTDALAAVASVPGAPVVDPQTLLAVGGAVRASEVLSFDYASVDGEVRRRRIEPHELVVVERRWYVVGWDLDRGAWRIYRADRIASPGAGGARFQRRRLPTGDARTYVAGRFRGSTDAGRWPCEGSVVLQAAARDVLPYVEPGSVDDLGDGRCRVRAGAWSWGALAASFGRFEVTIGDAQPAALATAFGEQAARFAAAS